MIELQSKWPLHSTVLHRQLHWRSNHGPNESRNTLHSRLQRATAVDSSALHQLVRQSNGRSNRRRIHYWHHQAVDGECERAARLGDRRTRVQELSVWERVRSRLVSGQASHIHGRVSEIFPSKIKNLNKTQIINNKLRNLKI